MHLTGASFGPMLSESVRAAGDTPESAAMTSSSTRGLPFWVSPAILAAAAAYLHSRWDELPARWVVHWGADGRANGWAGKSWPEVYFPLLMGLGVWVIMEAVGAAVRSQSEAATLTTLPFLRWVSVGLSLMLAYLAIQLPLGHPEIGHTLKVVALLVGGGIVAGIVHSSLAFAAARREGTITLLPGYHGAYYANREDDRLFVPKLSGMGWTLNFSNPLAWPVLVLSIALPLVLAAVVVWLAR